MPIKKASTETTVIEKEGHRLPVTRDLTKLKTISIASARQQSQELLNNTTENNSTNAVSGPVESFTMEAFYTVWNEYARQMKEQGKDTVYLTLTKRKPVVDDNNQIILMIDNKSQETSIEREKGELLEYIRSGLNNFALQLRTEITQSEDSAFLYTNKDKFKKMAEKNPNLLLLQKRLNLDIEF